MIFLKGFVIGLSIAAPVGPIGVLCIQRTLAYGRKSGFLQGLAPLLVEPSSEMLPLFYFIRFLL